MLRALSKLRLCCGLALALFATQAGCDREHWVMGAGARALDEQLAAALGDTALHRTRQLTPEQIPEVRYPRSLRPCCAFGSEMGVAVGTVPLPGVELGNLIDPSDLGPHRYDNGFLSLDASDRRGLVDQENNGLVYTCRGGFLDLSHVRDNADNTLALVAASLRHMDTGGVYEVPPQGAAMRVVFHPIPEAVVRRAGERRLATMLARWIAYQLSIWHEIATFYGYASVAGWPEKISAFSPEDLYSNQLGARIAAGVVMAGGARSDPEYHINMDAWLERTLERLGAVPLEEASTAMQRVDGAWWDSTKRIPDWTLVKRRNFDVGPTLSPWILENATPGTKGEIEPLAACAEAAPPLVLQVENGVSGLEFRDVASVEFEVDDLLAGEGFPFPRERSRLVDQEDFPAIVDEIRRATLEHFGEGADRP